LELKTYLATATYTQNRKHKIICDAARLYRQLGIKWDRLDSEHHEDRSTWTHRLLYIGMVYDQTFNERVLQHMRGDDVWLWIQDNYEYEVTFKAARIGLPDRQRISPELVQAVESLLIGVMQPRGNIRSTRTYRWRPLKIINTRQFKPLRPTLSTSDLA